MSKYIMSIALLGAFLVAAPAMAEYEQFMVWRTDASYWNKTDSTKVNYVGNMASYGPEATMMTLGTLYKGGAQNATNGTVGWYVADAAWWVEPKNATDFSICFNGANYGDNVPNFVDMGIVLKGGIGSPGIGGLFSSGMCANVSLNLKELVEDSPMEWVSIGTALSGVASLLGYDVPIDKQSYLNGAKSTSTTVGNSTDAMETYLYAGMISELLGGIGDGAEGKVTLKMASGLRNTSSVSLIAVVEPRAVGPDNPSAPEPATMALMGLGLAGLGLARRRMRK